MIELFKEIVSAPIANVLIIVGAVFVFVAVVGNVAGKIEPGTPGRFLAALVGAPLIGILVQLPVRPASSSGSDSTATTAHADSQTNVNEGTLGPGVGPTGVRTTNGSGLVGTLGPVFDDGDPLPLAVRKWPLRTTRYSQVRYSWRDPGSRATFDDRRIHVPDLGHRLFTVVDFIFAPGGGDPPLVRVVLRFRDPAAARYVREQAIRHLAAPGGTGNASWVNPGGGRSAISPETYLIDVSKF